MATNYIQDGKVIDYTNGGSAIVSGAVVVIGALIGVALTDIAANAVGAVQICDVFELPKATAAVIGAGEEVIYDVSASEFDDNAAVPATGDVSKACVAVEAAGNGDTTVKVLLNVGVGVVAA